MDSQPLTFCTPTASNTAPFNVDNTPHGGLNVHSEPLSTLSTQSTFTVATASLVCSGAVFLLSPLRVPLLPSTDLKISELS